MLQAHECKGGEVGCCKLMSARGVGLGAASSRVQGGWSWVLQAHECKGGGAGCCKLMSARRVELGATSS